MSALDSIEPVGLAPEAAEFVRHYLKALVLNFDVFFTATNLQMVAAGPESAVVREESAESMAAVRGVDPEPIVRTAYALQQLAEKYETDLNAVVAKRSGSPGSFQQRPAFAWPPRMFVMSYFKLSFFMLTAKTQDGSAALCGLCSGHPTDAYFHEVVQRLRPDTAAVLKSAKKSFGEAQALLQYFFEDLVNAQIAADLVASAADLVASWPDDAEEDEDVGDDWDEDDGVDDDFGFGSYS